MRLKVRPLDLDAAGKTIVILNELDALELGLHSLDRVCINDKLTAIVNTSSKFVKKGEAVVYEEIREILNLKDNQEIDIKPITTFKSKEYIRNKIDGRELEEEELKEIVRDVVDRNLNDLELAAFITALYIRGLSKKEIEGLIKAMTETGNRLDIKRDIIADKHSIGGVPGDKTTMLLVPVIASSGLTIPKTSSRAITSPAGTADRVEILTNVELEKGEIEKVVEKTNGCMVWGGALDLAPADDLFIQIEHPLHLDPMLMPSILSKKRAVNATHVVIDIPAGMGAKIQTFSEAKKLADDFISIGKDLDMIIECGVTFGEQPIGHTIGPALEAREALDTIMGNFSYDLVDKVTSLAGILLEITKKSDNGKNLAFKLLKNKAEDKLREIIEEQGGDPKITSEDIEVGEKTLTVYSKRHGKVIRVSNAQLVKLANTLGCPKDKKAGVIIHKKLGETVKENDRLLTLYAEKNYKLEAAEKKLEDMEPIVVVDNLEKYMLTKKFPEERVLFLRT